MFHSLLVNASTLVLIGFVYSLLYNRFLNRTILFRVITGVLFGSGALISMYLTFYWHNGISFDGRTIFLSLAGYIGGPLTGMVAMIPAILYRIIMGGSGTQTGIYVIITAALLGCIFFWIKKKRPPTNHFLHAFLLGIVVHVITILLFFTLPTPDILDIIGLIVFSMMLLFPLATGLIGWLFHEQEEKYKNIRIIKENEERFKKYINQAPVGFFIYNRSAGRIRFANDTFFHLTGIQPDNLSKTSLSDLFRFNSEAMNITGFFAENDCRQQVELKKKASEKEYADLNQHRIDENTHIVYLNEITEIIRAERAVKKQERIEKLAFMGTRDGIWIWDIEKSIQFDERWDRLLGYKPGEIEYTPEWFQSRVHPEDRVVLDEALENYLSGKKDYYEVEYRIRSAKDDWRWIWGIGMVSKRDGEGRPVQISGTHRDITDRKEMEENIRKNEERYALAQEAAGIGTWELDLVGGKLTVSQLAKKITGSKMQSFTGKYDFLIRHAPEEDKKRVEEVIKDAIDNQSAFEFEHRIQRKDVKIQWVSSKGKVIAEKEKPVRIIGIIQDITKRKETELQLENSSRTFKALFNNSMEGIVYSNLNNQYVYANTAFHKMTGYSPKEMAGKSWYDITLEKWHDKQKEIYKNKLLVKGQSGIFEKEYRHKNGNIIPVQLTASLDYDHEGNPVGIWTIVRNISEIKKAMKDLDLSEARFRTMISSSPVGTFLMDRKGRMIYLNEAFVKLTGKTGKPLKEIWWNSLHKDDLKSIRESFTRSLRAGKTYEGTVRYLLAGGIIKNLEIKTVPIKSQNKISGFVGLVLDITDRVNTEKILEEQKKLLLKNIDSGTVELEKKTKNLEATQKALTYLLEDVNETRNELENSNKKMASVIQELEAFSYSVSHDLRAPLRSIDGFSYALLEDYSHKLEGEGKDFLERIHQSSVRMGQLIEDLLQLSRISRSETFSEKINISTLCHEIFELLINEEPDRAFTLHIEENLSVHSDRRLVRIMLQNLLENAWKFTRNQKKAVIKIGMLKTKADEKRPVLFIEDNGTGFNMKYQQEIFIPFKRLHDEGSFEGTGIGLATVKRIANRLEIEISVESNPEKGSSFFLKFPG